jgi:hypothetical protein
VVSSRVTSWCQLDNATNTKHATKNLFLLTSVNHFLQNHSEGVGRIISAKKHIFIITLPNIHSGTRGQIEWHKIKKMSIFLVATKRLTSVIDCSYGVRNSAVICDSSPCRTNPTVLFGSKLQLHYWTYVTHTDSIQIISLRIVCYLHQYKKKTCNNTTSPEREVFFSNHKIKNISPHLSDQKRTDYKGE